MRPWRRGQPVYHVTQRRLYADACIPLSHALTPYSDALRQFETLESTTRAAAATAITLHVISSLHQQKLYFTHV